MLTFDEAAGAAEGSSRYRAMTALRDTGGLSRAQLARRASLAPSTVTALVRALSEEGIVVEADDVVPVVPTTRPGPRGRGLVLNPGLGRVAGVDFGFRTVRVLLTDLAAGELGVLDARLPDAYTAEQGLSTARSQLERLLADTGTSPAELGAIGMALPGPVDSRLQEVVDSPILPGWAGVSAASIAAEWSTPVTIENDANLAALGEHVFGAGRGLQDTLTVKFHSGVGAGVILHGELVTGRHGGAGEIGHTSVEPRGPLCRCGKRGCLDTVASVAAILETMGGLHTSLGVSDLLTLVDAGDPGALRVVRDAAAAVGQVVANASLLLAPERIVVVGAMARAGAVVTQPIVEALDRDLLPSVTSPPDVVVGELGDRHTALGAVALALGRVGWLPRRSVAAAS